MSFDLGLGYQAAGSGSGSAGGRSAVVLLGALVLLAAALGWRSWRAWRLRQHISAALDSPDPEQRRGGIRLAAERGLAETGGVLLKVAQRETDPAVLAALVEVIAQRQWEPASTAKIVELRLWGKAYVEAHQELRGAASDRVPPLRPARAPRVPPGHAVPLVGDEPVRVTRGRRSSDASSDHLAALGAFASTSNAHGTTPNAEAATDDDGIRGVRVLVTGAGGPAGVAVIEELVHRGASVVAVDADPTAVGLRLAHEGHVVPRADAPGYLPALLDVVTATRPQALLCTVAEEYATLAPAEHLLHDLQVATLFPTLEAVRVCLDKWAFHQAMSEAGVPVPATALGEVGDVRGPWIVKPRFGRGSRDVRLVTRKIRLPAVIRETPEAIVQTRLLGREFTVDALVAPDGTLAGAAPRWRLETKAGISTKGRTFEDPNVVHAVGLTLKAAGLVGPANVQGFVADDGTVTIHEVNPRFSGGLPLSQHAGADLVGEYLRAVLGLPMRPERLVARPGVLMLRHFAEVFEEAVPAAEEPAVPADGVPRIEPTPAEQAQPDERPVREGAA